MKHAFVTTMLFALALVIAGCTGANTDVERTPDTAVPEQENTMPEETAPEQETDSVEPSAPVKGEASVVDSKTDALGGGSMAELGSKIGEVACNASTNKITFTFENTGIHVWNLDQKAPFVSTEEKNVKVFINKYEANSGSTQFHPDTREPMFGPSETFSENCAGVVQLSPGDAVTCTLENVKLNRGTGSEGLKAVNQIFIDSPSIDDNIEFTC